MEEAGLFLFLLGYAYDEVGSQKRCHGKFHQFIACKTSVGCTAGVFFR